jgi:hypothetical protein
MFEYIKKPYISPVEGITNTKTGWKITTDPEGVVIVDEFLPSVETLNRLVSDRIIPSGEKVYIWYKLELSNGEIKDYVGPIEFISREDNITSDLKPITRVNTPSALWDDDNLNSGYNNLIIKSSEFNGDPLDGHLATTWVFKTPDDKIIDFKIFDTINIYQITLNRAGLNLDKYNYIKAYVKHHSANGSVSDFGLTIIPIRVYPFKFVDDNIFNSRLDYVFNIIPYDIGNPNISEIRVVSLKDGLTKLTFTDMNTLTFTIPAYTLADDSSYYIQSFVSDTQDGKYPLKLDSLVHTKSVTNSILYSNVLEYDLTDMVVSPDTSVDINYHVRDKLVNNKLISYNKQTSKFNLHTLNTSTTELDTTILTHDVSIDALFGVDYKLFNLSNNKLILITRLGTSIKIYRLRVVNNIVTIDTTFTIIESIVTNTAHNLANTATISEDEKYVYFISIKDTYIELGAGNLATSIYDVLDNRTDLTTVSYNPNTMVLQTVGDKKLISFGGNGDLWYYYNINDLQWIAMGKVPAELIADNFVPYRVMLLGDRSVLVCMDYDTPRKIIRFKPNMNTEVLDLNLSLRDYNIFTIDSVGILYAYSYISNSRIKLIPTKII